MLQNTNSPTTPFQLGQLVATPGALAAMTAAGQDPAEFLARHRNGDWGEVSTEDWQAARGIRRGGRSGDVRRSGIGGSGW
jgi:hypothetical protein